MELDQPQLDFIETLLQQKVAPYAAQIDTNSAALGSALGELGTASLLALRVPPSLGGAGFSEKAFRCFQEKVARYSGALAFLQAQHQSAGALLTHSGNKLLKQQYLPYMGSGKAMVGISFAHLRQQQSPLKAIAVSGGYQLNGQAPWVTGAGFFHTFIVAAVLPDEHIVYGMVPFQNSRQSSGGEVTCSQPMPLAAMNSTGTVTVQFQNWWLADSEVVRVDQLSAISKSDRLNVLQHSFFALGCARAGLDILENAYQQKKLAFIQKTFETLEKELKECRESIFSTSANDSCFAESLHLRAWAIELAVRCAHGAIVASGGAANSIHHPAQRVYREALVYSVSGQTIAVMEATLTRLAARQ